MSGRRLPGRIRHGPNPSFVPAAAGLRQRKPHHMGHLTLAWKSWYGHARLHGFLCSEAKLKLFRSEHQTGSQGKTGIGRKVLGGDRYRAGLLLLPHPNDGGSQDSNQCCWAWPTPNLSPVFKGQLIHLEAETTSEHACHCLQPCSTTRETGAGDRVAKPLKLSKRH